MKVVLDYYSGISNPSWELPDKLTNEFRARLAGLPLVPQPPAQHPQHPQGMGYKGMVVSLSADPADTIRVIGESVYYGQSTDLRIDQGRALERWLFDVSAPADLLQRYRLTFKYVTMPRNEQRIDMALGGAGSARPVGGFGCRTAPNFAGNRAPWMAANNNCYSYANNHPARAALPPIPGRNDAQEPTTTNALRTAALQDRLVLVPVERLEDQVCPEFADGHYVVICLREDGDFHCLRLDRSGVWSHKDGRAPVKRIDDSGTVIRDLRVAVFRIPLSIVGFYMSRASTRIIEQ